MVSNTYKFTETAKIDLDNILHYVSIKLFNFEATKQLFEKVVETIDNICAFPESNPVINNEYLNRQDIRKAIINNYIMYYIFQKDVSNVLILRIVYGKRNLEEILKDM